MQIKKKAETYNDYVLTISYGQLNAIYRALEKDHSDVLADELFAELGWYMENVPGPGEDEAEYKKAKDAEKEAEQASDEITGGEGERDLSQIGTEVGAGEGPAAGHDLEGAEPPVPAQGPEHEADHLLERPPAHAPSE